MFKDYYGILEIDILASQTEIKNAYKTQAKKWHPDKNPGIDTTQRMQDINEAYLILNDAEARERYDKIYAQYLSKKQNIKEDTNVKRGNESHKTEYTNYESTFDFNDETLKHWMANASKQAAQNLRNMIIEFGKDTATGFKTFIMMIILGFGSAVIYTIIYIFINMLKRL